MRRKTWSAVVLGGIMLVAGAVPAQAAFFTGTLVEYVRNSAPPSYTCYTWGSRTTTVRASYRYESTTPASWKLDYGSSVSGEGTCIRSRIYDTVLVTMYLRNPVTGKQVRWIHDITDDMNRNSGGTRTITGVKTGSCTANTVLSINWNSDGKGSFEVVGTKTVPFCPA